MKLRTKDKKFQAIVFLVIFFSFNAVCQITMSYPKNRMVFQRNAQNNANIYIEGMVGGTGDMVQARLISLDNAGLPKVPNETTNWLNIAAVKEGSFSGAIFNQTAGWYNLEVQATAFGVPLDSPTTIKVGIGEVFVISGQSNAAGNIPNREPNNIFSSADDRINCINLYDNTTTAAPEMVFSHLDSFSYIAPKGITAWCWGVFADKITTNWDVPVLLFNAAIGNTGIFQWRASANGEMDPCSTNVETCMPYYYLKKTLINYASKTGIRAILWHQGENDNGIFESNSFPPEYYQSNIKQLIDKTRADYQNDISWIIAKVSRIDNYISIRVTDGQQLMIDTPNYNTFLGPLSDNIQPSGSARDLNHFWGQGLVDLGNGWFSSVNNENFVTHSKPHMAKYTIIGCSSVKSGDWDDPTTWSAGRVPAQTDDVVISTGHVITLNSTAYLKSLNLGGELQVGELGELQFTN